MGGEGRVRFIQCNTNQFLVRASQKHVQRDYLSEQLEAIFGHFFLSKRNAVDVVLKIVCIMFFLFECRWVV